LTIDDSELDPVDEQAAPLVLAVGRLVLGAAMLEKVLLVDIISRDVQQEGTVREELGRELAELEGKPGGVLLKRLRKLGIPPDLADRVNKVIQRRNRVVHHLLEEPGVVLAMHTGEGIEKIVADIDSVAIDCQQVVNELTLVVFPTLLNALGTTLPELADRLGSIDPSTIEQPAFRQQVEAAQTLRGLFKWKPEPFE
jgi:hypothetical protein